MRPTRPTVLLATAMLALAPALAGCSTTPASNLEQGTCYNDTEEGGAEGTVKRVEPVDCGEPHQAEVVGIDTLDEGPFPGAESLIETASATCPDLFEAYTGRAYADAPEDLVPMLPSEENWDGGDRRILCVARASEPMTGSLAR